MRKIFSKLKNKLLKRLDEDEYLLSITPWNKRNVYVIGTPLHSNVGDNAIAYAEMEYLKSIGIPENRIKEITGEEYRKYGYRFRNILLRKHQLILLHGGGNMGNQWLIEELYRRDIMTDLKSNRTVIFPQTFSYSDDEEGSEELKKSAPYYNERRNLTITAREKVSFERMKMAYPDARCILTPDIVFSLNPECFPINSKDRHGLLFVLRRDGEKVLSLQEEERILESASKNFSDIRFTDMHTELPVEKTTRKEAIEEKINQFAEAEVVITDRLHCMIFCAISGTPCIVFRNNNHKISATYEWIKKLPYIRFVNSVDEAANELKQMNLSEKYSYNFREMRKLFDPLRKAILEENN